MNGKSSNPLPIILLVVLPIVCGGLAAGVQALRITGRPTKYVALGKVVFGAGTYFSTSEAFVDKIMVSLSDPAYLGAQAEILAGGELRRHALDRVRGLHPEMKEIDVKTNVIPTKGSLILDVSIIGEEPNYTRAYCNALLDEYMAFRRKLIDDSVGSSVTKLIDEVVSSDKVIKARRDAFNNYADSHDRSLLDLEHFRLVKLVSTLRGKIAELERTNQQGSKLQETTELLAKSEKQLADNAEQSSTYQKLKTDAETTEKELGEKRSILDKLDPTFSIRADRVAIMERPQVAVEQEPELTRELSLAALLGAGVGFVLAISIIAATRRPNVAPPLVPAH